MARANLLPALLSLLLILSACADSVQTESGSAGGASSNGSALAVTFDGESYRAGDGLLVERSADLVRVARRNAPDDDEWGVRLQFAPPIATAAPPRRPESGDGVPAGDNGVSEATSGEATATSAADQANALEITLFGPSGENLAGRYVLSPATAVVTFGAYHTGFPIVGVEFSVGTPVQSVAFDAPARASAGAAASASQTGSSRVGVGVVPTALVADLGHINFQSRAAWRRDDFELYQWESVPSILYFDFADYAVQRRMFGRLGFFVAVVGEAGTVRPEEEYEGRHSYNAHDYRPEDLVAFFETAEEAGVQLNEYESLLRDILLAYGIIGLDSGRLTPGTGAVVSVAQETWRPLRQRLVRHEALHGLFYAVPEFCDAVFSVWRSQPETLTQFFYHFLGSKGMLDGREGYSGYDVDREYLLVNEAMAHVLQLLPSEVVSYYRYYAGRTGELVPESRSVVLDFSANLEAFINGFRLALERALEETVGFHNGRLLAWYPEGSEILD